MFVKCRKASAKFLWQAGFAILSIVFCIPHNVVSLIFFKKAAFFSAFQTLCVCVCVCVCGGGGGLMGCVQTRGRGVPVPRLPGFILLGSFSNTLLVVSTLDMIAICSRFCSPEGVIKSSCGNYGSFLTWGW